MCPGDALFRRQWDPALGASALLPAGLAAPVPDAERLSWPRPWHFPGAFPNLLPHLFPSFSVYSLVLVERILQQLPQKWCMGGKLF